ncbi:MAG: hypothetical protein AAF490_21705 [Chloroflexota bacterium]
MLNPSQPIPTQPFIGGQYRIENGRDIISWTNKNLPRNPRLYLTIGFWLFLLLPVGYLLTSRLWAELILFSFNPPDRGGVTFSAIIVLACWAGILFNFFNLLRLTWTESVVIDDENIMLQYEGLLAFKAKYIPIGDIWRLSFEKFKHNQDQEFRSSVNIIHKERDKLAYWMGENEAHRLYLLITEILHKRGLDDLIQLRNEME